MAKSAIATMIGRPLMLDSYTYTTCMKSQSRSSYARAMIELHADKDMKESMVIFVPNIDDEGHTCVRVTFEYEWKPPHCCKCKSFGHLIENYPNVTKVPAKKNVDSRSDEFQ
ncbi:hypothetical protein Tco_0419724, partial [Tanacetum coccineum]